MEDTRAKRGRPAKVAEAPIEVKAQSVEAKPTKVRNLTQERLSEKYGKSGPQVG